MKIDYKKTKLMVFNPCKSLGFKPKFTIEGNTLETVEDTRLLGLTIRSDMKCLQIQTTWLKKLAKDYGY